MAWHVFAERTDTGWVQATIPPLAARPPARDANYSADGCWCEEHDHHGLRTVYVWMGDELHKQGHITATATRKALGKQPRKALES